MLGFSLLLFFFIVSFRLLTPALFDWHNMHSVNGLDFRALEVFATVCELHNMTLAAHQLGMTQPAVSHTIKRLEEVTGVVLVDRSRRPLTVTTAGHWLAQAATQILNEARQIPIALRHIDKGLELRLRIGLVDSLSDPFVPELVNQLHASIHYLSIINGIASVVRTGLLDRTLDLIITNDPMEDADGIVRHPILSESYVVVVPRTGAKLPLTDLTALGRKLPLIRSHPRSRTGMDIERQLRRMGVNIERRFEFDSSAAILSMVSSGFGWAIMPPLSIFEIRPLLRHVRVVPFPGPLFSRQLHLFARAGELEATAKRIALMSRKILRDRYLPELLKIGSWLNGQIVVGDT
jgi:DNA-binding transcriptional LysR family regulator